MMINSFIYDHHTLLYGDYLVCKIILRFFLCDKEMLRLIMLAHGRKTCKLVQFCDPTCDFGNIE